MRAGGGPHRSRRGGDHVPALIPPRAAWTHQAGRGPPDFPSLLQFSRRAGSDFETLEPGLPTQTLLSFASAWNPVARGVGAGQRVALFFTSDSSTD